MPRGFEVNAADSGFEWRPPSSLPVVVNPALACNFGASSHLHLQIQMTMLLLLLLLALLLLLLLASCCPCCVLLQAAPPGVSV